MMTGNVIVSNMRVIIEQAVLPTTPGGLHFCSGAFNLTHDTAKRDALQRRFKLQSFPAIFFHKRCGRDEDFSLNLIFFRRPKSNSECLRVHTPRSATVRRCCGLSFRTLQIGASRSLPLLHRAYEAAKNRGHRHRRRCIHCTAVTARFSS